MPSLNKVLLIGHLGRDPELRQTNSGKPVCNFTLATNEKRRGEDHTEWFRIVAWEQRAEFAAQYLTKGSLAYVEGRIGTREWKGRDGETKSGTEITATNIIGLKYKDRTDGAQVGVAAAQSGRNGFVPDPGLDPEDLATNPPRGEGQGGATDDLPF